MDKINLEKLNNEDYLNELEEKVDKLELFMDIKVAYHLYRQLKKAVQEYEKEILNSLLVSYQIILVKLQYILFLKRLDNEVYNLFKYNLVIGLRMDYVDLLERLKLRISFLPEDERDQFKRQLINILLENGEELTGNSIAIGGKPSRPTIGAWISLYNSTLGTGPKDNLDQRKFYIKSQDYLKLNEAEKLWVKELFDIYEYLKRSSSSLEGNEDTAFIEDIDGKKYMLSDGRMIEFSQAGRKVLEDVDKKLEIPKTEEEKEIADLRDEEKKYKEGGLEQLALEEEIKNKKNIEELEIMAKKYKENSLERKALEEEIARLKKR